MPAALIDTNVLVYAHDQNDPLRQDRALQLLRVLEATSQGRLTVQCLAEFSAVAMHRLQPVMSPEETLAQIERLQRAFTVYAITPIIVLEALRGVRTYRLSYYDAQLWASARLTQTTVIFSEDFNPSVLEGVRFINPFDPGFSAAMWRGF